MFDNFLARARNLQIRIMLLLRGHLVRSEHLEATLNSLEKRLEAKLNNEITNVLQQLESQAFQLSGLCNSIDDQSQRSELRLNFLQDLLRQHVRLVLPIVDELEQSLRHELVEALLSTFIDNFDPYCGASIEAIQQEINNSLAYYRRNFDKRVDLLIAQLPMVELKQLYSQLADTESRLLLSKLIAYRLLGITKVRLRSAVDVESDRKFYAKLQDMLCPELPSLRSGSFELLCYDLRHIGLTFRCYTIPFAINAEFRNQQYANHQVYPRQGDWVLDCGACWGDTSLWLAEQAGPSGKVFSFEFIPSNLEIFQANIAMNPTLSSCIELVIHPIAENSGNVIHCADNGASSTFKMGKKEEQSGSSVEAITISIDDWVQRHNPVRLDFVKMDIEGAELDALLGARETLKRFQPQLAIAIYHRAEDLYQIPNFIESLNLGYQFYLKHPTAAGFETVLLACCEKN